MATRRDILRMLGIGGAAATVSAIPALPQEVKPKTIPIPVAPKGVITFWSGLGEIPEGWELVDPYDVGYSNTPSVKVTTGLGDPLSTHTHLGHVHSSPKPPYPWKLIKKV